MKRAFLVATSALALTCTAAEARVFNFSFTSAAGTVGAGAFTTGAVGAPFTVTAISGTIAGFAITGLSPYAFADQLLFPAGPNFFTLAGISFSGSNGVNYNLTNNPTGVNSIANSLSDPEGDGVPLPDPLTQISIRAAVPEPAAWAMMICGFGLVGASLRRRARVSVAFS